MPAISDAAPVGKADEPLRVGTSRNMTELSPAKAITSSRAVDPVKSSP